MYSIFFSKIDIGYPYCLNRLKEIIKPNSKVVIIPWTMARELDSEGLDNYFSSARKNRYINLLKLLGIDDNNNIELYGHVLLFNPKNN